MYYNYWLSVVDRRLSVVILGCRKKVNLMYKNNIEYYIYEILL